MGTIMISSGCGGPARMARAESPREWGAGALHAAAWTSAVTSVGETVRCGSSRPRLPRGARARPRYQHCRRGRASRRRRRRGPVAARRRAARPSPTDAGGGRESWGPGPEEPRRLQFFDHWIAAARGASCSRSAARTAAPATAARAPTKPKSRRAARACERARLPLPGRALVQLDEEPHGRFNGGQVEAPPEGRRAARARRVLYPRA